jgi:three-Cys-motif partner protein
MAKHQPVVWPIEPHTAAKHAILRRYLQAWIPILSRGNARVVYIDGFAGPGEYEGGEQGSPILALTEAAAAARQRPLAMTFLFVEENAERAANLEVAVSRLKVPPTFHVELRRGRCDVEINALLDRLRANNQSLAPTFALLDPFGWVGTPMSLVQRLMSNRSCEVLITFMLEEMNRFLEHEDQPGNFDELFGTPDWRLAPSAGNPGRIDFLRALYQRQLETTAQIRYVRWFEMRNHKGAIDYFLFFGTNNQLGLRKMKEAMWRVDAIGGCRFSDATDPDQLTLLAELNVQDIARRLSARFHGQTVTVEAVEIFIVEDTPYCDFHYKRALKGMEQADPPALRVVDAKAGRRKGQFPNGTVLAFAE